MYKLSKIIVTSIGLVFGSLTVCVGAGTKVDPLPSWADGGVKDEIVKFVKEVTDKKSPKYVKKGDRIATLDLDGTLMCERPINFQRALAMRRLRDQVKNDNDLLNEQPYKAAWYMDEAYHGNSNNHNFIFLTAFKGHTHDEYEAYVEEFFDKEKDGHWGVSYDKLLYQPGKELVKYLENNDFRVYICSTTEEVCIRSLLKRSLGFYPDHIIGNEVYMEFQVEGGKPKFFLTDQFKQPENRKEGKCLYINYELGKAPIFAFGNSMGDHAMLSYASKNGKPHFAMILDHDDPHREVEYHVDTLLSDAKRHGWKVVSMKNDFKRVFNEEIRRSNE